MSSHRLPKDTLVAPWVEPDPGNGGSFGGPSGVMNNGRAIFVVRSGGAETRTLPAPQRVGQRAEFLADTLVGAITVTVTGGVSGFTTFTLNNAGDSVWLEAISVAGVIVWQLQGSTGAETGEPETFGADQLLVGGVKVSPYKFASVGIPLNSGMVNQAFFIADRAYQVTGVEYVNATPGSDSGAVNVQLTHDTGTTAPGAGTALLTNNTNAGFNAKSTANTLGTGTLTGTTSSLQLAAGDRLSIKFTGTLTALAGVVMTVQLQPI